MKRLALAVAASALALVGAGSAGAQERTNEEIDRNNDGVLCVNDLSGGFGSVLIDNQNPAFDTGCPAAFVRVLLNP